MDSRVYPESSGAVKSRYINNVLVEFGVAKKLRTTLTLAQLNAGVILLPALPGVKWRLLDWGMVSNGGAATTGTSVNIIGTSGGSPVQLAVALVAALTRSAVVRAGATNAGVLADSASFRAMDVNTPITCINVGTAMTVLVTIDIDIDYVADPVT